MHFDGAAPHYVRQMYEIPFSTIKSQIKARKNYFSFMFEDFSATGMQSFSSFI